MDKLLKSKTGGEVYGNKDYADFTEAYTNSSNEKAITIGAGQWYGSEAKKLLNLIQQTDPVTFSGLDSAGIAADLAASDWTGYKVSKTSAKAKCIVKIIDSEVGHRCQDQLVDEQMESYINYAGGLGVTDMDAKMMCANFRHQGGSSAVTRILANTPAPYTLDHLYETCQKDTGNQVGAYKSRQKMVYNSLKQYITNYVVTPEAAIQAAIVVAQNEVGYLEKETNNDLDSKTGNAGDGNFTKYWRDIQPSFQGQAWCACFVTWVFDQAFGREQATPAGKILGSLNKEDRFEVDGTRCGTWIHIKVSSLGIGYMHKDYVSATSGSGRNSAVAAAQKSLNTRYGSALSVDGIWGSLSNKAFICGIQTELNNVYGGRLSVDGIWGSKTASACSEHILKKGTKSTYVGILQIGLHAHKIALSNGIDNDFGVSTKQGVCTFQGYAGISQDGTAGGNTFKKLANS